MARIVVAGAGATGASVAYHLALLGARDVVLAEEVPQLRPGGRLVVDDQGADGTSSRTTVPNGNERSFTLSP